ncbi:MAG: RidA family protein [Campylobacteraceae bacterium]|nr:RidA family protein [Campylobacteraceae bacterium]
MKVIATNSAPQAIGPYSQGILANGFLFVSGQVPLNSKGEFVEGGIEAQTKQSLANLKAILSAADLEFKDVVKTTIFLADMGDFDIVNKIYAEAFGEHKPARSTIEVAKLPKGALVEIELIAKAY